MTSKKRSGDDPRLHQGSGKAPGYGKPGGLGEDEGRRTGNLSGTGDGSLDGAYLAGYRAHAYEMLQSGGLAESRLGLEILYLLPADFVKFYSALFHRALVVRDESVMHGRSGGLGKAKGAQGIVTGSDVGAQAKGSGKKWKNTPMAVGNEVALRVKEGVDKELIALVRSGTRQLSAAKTAQGSGTGHGGERTANGGTGALQCNGTIRVLGVAGQGPDGVTAPAVRKCRRFLKDGWEYCPACGTRVTQ